MIKIAICEDEKMFADSLEKSINIWAAKKAMNVKIRKFDNGVPLLHCINDNGMFDVIFMDVEMERMNGLEAAAKIRERDYITTLIFVSQHEDYYKEAYNVHPFHFLSKPVEQKQLNEVMDAYMQVKKQDTETYTYCVNKAQYTVLLSDILYFNSERRHISMVCRDGVKVFYGKLNEVEKQVEDKNCKFLRIHQSFLVNVRYIREYHYSDLIMANGENLTISRDNRKKMREIHKLLLEQS